MTILRYNKKANIDRPSGRRKAESRCVALKGFEGKYLGKEISIPAEECYAVSIVKSYKKIGKFITERYVQVYKEYGDFQTFVNKGIRDGYDMLDNCLQQTVSNLIQSGHYPH